MWSAGLVPNQNQKNSEEKDLEMEDNKKVASFSNVTEKPPEKVGVSASDLQKIEFPGTWMCVKHPLAYRVLPKCGCSSIGQIMHFLDHGFFYGDSIHNPSAPLLKWGTSSSRSQMIERFLSKRIIRFTFVRNPFRRIFSAFRDKILSVQASGGFYRGGYIHSALVMYGLRDVRKDPPQVAFRAFLRMLVGERTVPKFESEMRGNKSLRVERDIHWTPIASHLRYTANVAPNWSLDFIGHIEHIKRDLKSLFDLAQISLEAYPPETPKENVSGQLDLPIGAFFGDFEIEVVRLLYREDFELFGYDDNPLHELPVRDVDLEYINWVLSQPRPPTMGRTRQAK